MQIYSYSEVEQQLSTIFDLAQKNGKVLIQQNDGRVFALKPEKMNTSPLDVPSIKANISTQEIVDIIRSGRERS